MATGMVIDGIAASEAIDSSGEILDVEGCDISDLEEGRGTLNWEHRNEDSPGASPSDTVGHIIYAKKIFKRSECETDRQREYWDKVKLPYIYIIARLYDGAGHAAAKDLAAQVRDHAANKEPILVRYSIEGSTLLKEGQKLKRSVARRVACTIKPCNRSCASGIIEDPHAPPGFELEKPEKKVRDLLADLTDAKKSEPKLPHPSYTPLGGAYEGEYDPMVKEEQSTDELVKRLIKAVALRKATEMGLLKTYTAGTYGGAPGTMTGGAALQREHLERNHKTTNLALAALRDYGKVVTDRDDFRKFVKHRLPEADDSFIDHFVDRVHDFSMKKAEPFSFTGENSAQPKIEVNVGAWMKLQALTIELRKAVAEAKERPVHTFGDHQVLPGRAQHAGGEFALLHEDKDGYVGVPSDRASDWEPEDLVRLPRLKEATHYRVHERPRVLVNGVPHVFSGEA